MPQTLDSQRLRGFLLLVKQRVLDDVVEANANPAIAVDRANLGNRAKLRMLDGFNELEHLAIFRPKDVSLIESLILIHTYSIP